MEAVFGQEIGEDGAHLLEAECDLAALLLAGVSDDGEMGRVNFEPGGLGSGSERDTEDHGEETYAERDRQESRHGRRAKGFKEMLPRASCERSSEDRLQVKEKPRDAGPDTYSAKDTRHACQVTSDYGGMVLVSMVLKYHSQERVGRSRGG
jgi:hypothetical protein